VESTPVSSSSRPTAGTAEALWRAWIQNKDVAARDRLVLSYAPMVKYLACRKVRELPAHCELDDLVSCGLLALIAAVDRFDPAKGATFEQYAWTRVSGAIMDELRRQDWAPRSLRRNGRAIERAREAWQLRTGRLPSDEELPVYLTDQGEFGKFYKAMFARQVEKEDGRTLFLEYAWDMNWCDPCAASPLSRSELRELDAALLECFDLFLHEVPVFCVSEAREAFGVRPIYRRFPSGAGGPAVHGPNSRFRNRRGSP